MKKVRDDSKNLMRGDIVEVEWYDTHSSDRMTISDVEGLEEPKTTLAFGVVIRESCRYLTIASELCTDPLSDGTWVEQIPRGAIRSVALLGRRDLSELFGDAVASNRSSPRR